MTRSVPQVLGVLLLRARPFLPWAPRALRLRLAWANARPARRQGPAGASGPGHDAWPACGRGAHCLLVQLAGRSPVMTHCKGLRTARMRAGVAGGGPAQVAGWAALPSGHGRASRNPALAGPGPPFHCGPCRTVWSGSHVRHADAAVPPAPSWSLSPPTPPLPPGRCAGVRAVRETDDGAWKWQGQCEEQAWKGDPLRRWRARAARVAL